jgi:threonine dehydratase
MLACASPLNSAQGVKPWARMASRHAGIFAPQRLPNSRSSEYEAVGISVRDMSVDVIQADNFGLTGMASN